jgi:hypothetical protein
VLYSAIRFAETIDAATGVSMCRDFNTAFFSARVDGEIGSDSLRLGTKLPIAALRHYGRY